MSANAPDDRTSGPGFAPAGAGGTPSSDPGTSGSATVLYLPSPKSLVPGPVPAGAADPAATGDFTPAAPHHPPADYVPGHESNQTIGYDESDDTAPAPPVTVRHRPEELHPLPGVEVPGYVVLRELGRGGMGVVYQARDKRLDRQVALKMVLAGAHAGTAGLARFRAEAAVVAQLHHPNIVQIYETGEHDGRPYMALEFVTGGSLEDRLKDQPATPRMAAKLMATLATAMDFAHQRGVVHRDLKPGNVLLGAADNTSSLNLSVRSGAVTSSSLALEHWAHATVPKLADFGLAKRLSEESTQTQSGAILGTPCYMAPEQAKGNTREVGPTADVYSLGAMLYELLAGRPPFKANSPIDTIRQVIEQEPIPPRQLEPRVPHDLETICLKCLHKDPLRRYDTAAALADDLHRFLNNEPVLARPVPAWERAWKWGRRRPSIVALAGVCLLAVVGFIGMIVWFNLSLASERDQARAEEREAREREQTALEGQRLARVRSEGQKLADQAKVAATAGDWSTARLQLSKALTLTGAEPELKDLDAAAREQLTGVERELRTARERDESRARFREFEKLRDDAQFLGTLYTGMDLAANLRATRATVEKALAVYGIAPAGDAKPVTDPFLTDAQKRDVRDDCYLLLLILAEAQSQSPGPDGDAVAGVRAAVATLDSALRFGPPSRAWHFRQARYLRKLGDDAGATAAESAAAGAKDGGVFDHFLLADELYRREDFDGAIREFQAVLQKKPAHFWSQYLNALCLLRLHRPAEARAQLTACLALRTDFVWLYLLRGFAQGELNAFDGADADYTAALELPLDDFSRYVLFVNRGVLRIRQGRTAEAVEDLTAATKLRPGDYQAFVNLAQAYRREKKLPEALAQLDAAAKLEPELAHLYRLRGRLHLEMKHPDRALADLDRAVARESAADPFYADDHVERGRLLLGVEKPAEALAAFDAALAAKATHPTARRLRAEALFQLGRFADVVAAFDAYLTAGGTPVESVYRGRGLARVRLGQNPGAVDDFTKALELRPTAEVYGRRGYAYLACEAPKLARRDFDVALELDPKSVDAYLGRGVVAAIEKRPADAAKDAAAALKLGPPTPRVLYSAARIHALCGGDANEKRAIALVREALTAVPPEKRAAFVAEFLDGDAALENLRVQPRFEAMLRPLLPKR